MLIDEESSFYRAIIRLGRERQARRMIRLAGEKAFGPIPTDIESRLCGYPMEVLDDIITQLRAASGWAEFTRF